MMEILNFINSFVEKGQLVYIHCAGGRQEPEPLRGVGLCVEGWLTAGFCTENHRVYEAT